jgi:hypothetical protein
MAPETIAAAAKACTETRAGRRSVANRKGIKKELRIPPTFAQLVGSP